MRTFRELADVLRYEVILFTRDMGAIPVWAYSAACTGVPIPRF